jgi:hypothetical protein
VLRPFGLFFSLSGHGISMIGCLLKHSTTAVPIPLLMCRRTRIWKVPSDVLTTLSSASTSDQILHRRCRPLLGRLASTTSCSTVPLLQLLQQIPIPPLPPPLPSHLSHPPSSDLSFTKTSSASPLLRFMLRARTVFSAEDLSFRAEAFPLCRLLMQSSARGDLINTCSVTGLLTTDRAAKLKTGRMGTTGPCQKMQELKYAM